MILEEREAAAHSDNTNNEPIVGAGDISILYLYMYILGLYTLMHEYL